MAQFAGLSAVLFDLDGTLLDSAPDLGAAADQMRLARGLPSLPLSAYRPMAGAGARGMLGVAFGISPEAAEFEALREEFFTNYQARMTQNTRAFEGVAALIEGIRMRGLKWGVVTNKSARFTIPLTNGMALFETAGAIVSGDTTPFSKPHPAPLLEAARQLDVLAHQCLYVGDDERDIVAGHAAGMQTVAACYGYLHDVAQASHWGAEAQIYSPLDLLKLLPSS